MRLKIRISIDISMAYELFSANSLAIAFALLGWPVPLYYLYSWLRPKKAQP